MLFRSIAAFGWLMQRIEPVLAQSVALREQRSLFQCMAGHLACLDELWVGHLGDDAPLLLAARRHLADKLQRAQESAAPQSGVSAVVAQVKQAATQLLAPEPVVNNEKDVHKLLRALQDNARPLCAWWLRQNATDLRALRLNRTLAWLGITGLPDSNSDQITPLRGLVPDKLKRYQERFAQGHYADLLLELEASLASAPFWFDGVRMVWECLQALQAELAMVETEIQFALLLQRLPGSLNCASTMEHPLPTLPLAGGSTARSVTTCRQGCRPGILPELVRRHGRRPCRRSLRCCARRG